MVDDKAVRGKKVREMLRVSAQRSVSPPHQVRQGQEINDFPHRVTTHWPHWKIRQAQKLLHTATSGTHFSQYNVDGGARRSKSDCKQKCHFWASTCVLKNYSNSKLPYGFPLAIWSTRQLWHTTRMRLLSSLEL